MVFDELALPERSASGCCPCRRELVEADRTAFVNMIGFSKPIVTTRNGSPSDSKTRFMGTPNFVVTIVPNKKAKTEEIKTDVASQAFEPIFLMDMKRDTKVRCMDK